MGCTMIPDCSEVSDRSVPVFLDQVIDGLGLVSVDPAGEGREEELKREEIGYLTPINDLRSERRKSGSRHVRPSFRIARATLACELILSGDRRFCERIGSLGEEFRILADDPYLVGDESFEPSRRQPDAVRFDPRCLRRGRRHHCSRRSLILRCSGRP